MKKLIICTIVAIVLALIWGYNSNPTVQAQIDTLIFGNENVSKEEVADINVFMVVDGTDLRDQEHAVPFVTKEYISHFVEKVRERGNGRLWITYVDGSSENNPSVYLEISQKPPAFKEPEKSRSETESQHKERAEAERKKYIETIAAFERKDKTKGFLVEAEEILREAYSQRVITAKRGSDVHGAMNTGSKSLRSIPVGSATNAFMILISDGVDNIGKSLHEIPDHVQVMLVNNSVTKSRLADRVIEIDNLARLEEYIFR